MPVSADQSRLVRESFAKLRERLEPASVFFYEALFRRAPGLREMFRDDLTGQGMKFMSTLSIIVDNIDKPDAVGEHFAELGHFHSVIGVKAAHFEPMGEALIDTLREELGADFDAATETAWRAAYAELADRIIRRGEIT